MGMVNDAAYAALLGRTYLHTMTAYRPLRQGIEKLIYEAQPCGFSRSAHTSAPAPAEMGAVLPEADYRYAMYTLPAVSLQLGDRVEVTDGERVYHGRASDSFRYPGHCVTVIEVLEVESCGGQNSGETEEISE